MWRPLAQQGLLPFITSFEGDLPTLTLTYVSSLQTGAIFSAPRMPGFTAWIVAFAVSDFFAEQSDKSISRCLIRIWFAVGRTAEDVTYRSDFDKALLEELTDTKHLSADDICFTLFGF